MNTATERRHRFACRIQWIDSEGNPTPDNNPGIGEARCFTREDRPPSSWFPICPDHLKRMPLNGRWEFRRFAKEQA